MLPAWINKYIGIPYKRKGRSYEGCDCWGIVCLVLLEQFGIRVPTYTEHYRSWNKYEIHDLIQYERQAWQEVKQGEEKPGDVINLRVDGKDWHTGIIVGKGYFLHVMRGLETVIESYKRYEWKDRIAGIYRHAEFT